MRCGSGWDAIGGLTVDSANNLYTAGLFVNAVDFNPWGGGDHRSAQGRDILLKAGYTKVTSMTGGVTQWQAQGLPVASGQ